MATAEEDKIEALAQAWGDAIVANDIESIRRFVSSDWVLVDQTGIGDMNDFASAISSGDLSHSSMRTVEGTQRIRISGSTAVRTARVTNTAHYRGETFDADEWVTDVYVREKDGWTGLLTHVTPNQ